MRADNIKAEISTIEKLLDKLPKDCPIESMGLKNKRFELLKEL